MSSGATAPSSGGGPASGGGGGGGAADDSDDKYAKIKRQQWKFRQLAFLAFALLVVVGVVFSGTTIEETEDVLARAEQSAGRAAGKLMGGDIEGKERKFMRPDDADAAAVGGLDGIGTRRDLRPARPLDDGGAAAEAAAPKPAVPAGPSEAVLADDVGRLDAEVRRIKTSLPKGHFMETDPKALAATGKLQDATRQLLAARYGPAEPYRVRVVLEFQDTISDFAEHGPDGSFLVELAPSRLVPHSIFSYLEIARNWKSGAFHRIAGHVLQVQVGGHNGRSLAFQEYSPDFPHVERTVGYAGRPSGPAWYVSIQNNKGNHGPGSQQAANPNEADACIGKIIGGYADSVLRIKKVKGNGFLNDKKKHVLIKEMIILVPGEGPGSVDGYVRWKPTAGN